MTVNNPITPTPNPSPTVVLPLLIPISPQNTRATMLTSNQVRSASRGADGHYSSRLSPSATVRPLEAALQVQPCAEGS